MQVISKKPEFVAEKEAEAVETAARQAAKEHLELPHSAPNSVPALWARLKNLERMHGIKEP